MMPIAPNGSPSRWPIRILGARLSSPGGFARRRATLEVAATTSLFLMAPEGLDVDEFLARPATAHLATVGPHVRPVWFLWEDGAFWILTGPWSRVMRDVQHDRQVALVVDVSI